MDKMAITEEMHLEKEWFEQAREQKLETLPEFMNHILNDYRHDYGTICHAISACALAAAWAADNSDQDRCLTEGAYWYAIEYKKIKYCTFMVYYRTSSKYRFCSKCGKFKCFGKCGNHRIVSQHEVIKAIQDIYFSPEYRIEYRMER